MKKVMIRKKNNKNKSQKKKESDCEDEEDDKKMKHKSKKTKDRDDYDDEKGNQKNKHRKKKDNDDEEENKKGTIHFSLFYVFMNSSDTQKKYQYFIQIKILVKTPENLKIEYTVDNADDLEDEEMYLYNKFKDKIENIKKNIKKTGAKRFMKGKLEKPQKNVLKEDIMQKK